MPYVDMASDLVIPKGEGGRVRELWKNIISPQDPGKTYIGPNVNWMNMAKALFGTVGLLSQPDLVAPMQIGPVYHGSGSKFAKFADEFIGTGEGAQAFGRGHYLSEAPEVAETYMKAGQLNTIRKMYPDSEVQAAVTWYHSGNKSEALRRITHMIDEQEKYIKKWGVANFRKRYEVSGPTPPENRLNYLRDIQQKMMNETIESPGAIYEGIIHKGKQPREYSYLEWEDKLPDEQYQKISKALDETFGFRIPGGPSVEHFKEIFENRPGYTVYTELKQYLGNEATSKFLKKAGIDGIKYPSGTLSGMRGDKFNYVVFNPEDITIESVK